MNKMLIERIVVFSLLFIAIYRSSDSIIEKKYHEALREFVSIGIIPMSLHAAYRHMFNSGNIVKGGRFFEIEAGGANLGIALASIISYLNNFSNETMGSILFIYAIYLFVSMIVWLLFKPEGQNMLLMGGQFLSIVSILFYYSYIGLTTK